MTGSRGGPLREFAQKSPRLAACALGSAFCLAILLAAEGGLRLTDVGRPRILESDEAFGCLASDPVLGSGLKPDCSTRWVRRVRGQPAFDVGFSTDSYGRRRTPRPAVDAPTGKTLFFGCSFTLGSGLEDSQTIPAVFQSLVPADVVYNYAGRGFGTQQMLALIRNRPLQEETEPTPASRAVYLFREFHIPRVTGHPRIVATFAADFPMYELVGNGKAILRGSFLEARPVESRIAMALGHSRLASILMNRLPDFRPGLPLVAALVDASAEGLERKLGAKELTVVLMPATPTAIGQELRAAIRNPAVRFLDYSRLLRPSETGMSLIDGHPSAKADAIVARQLAKDLAVPRPQP